MSKIYDCCMFFNELDMLELRFNILNDAVDYFVVCEAEETHSGQWKPLNLLANWDRFKQWHNKIIYINAGRLSDGKRNSWERERYHRSQIAAGLFGAKGDDWAICADCDEIPDPRAVSYLRHADPKFTACRFELSFFYYDMNHRVDQGWSIGASKVELSPDPNDVRTNSTKRGQLESDFTAYAVNGGWHFSYFGGPQAILEKHAAFMHHSDPGVAELPRDPVYIAGAIAASKDLYGRDLTIVHVPTSDGLPQYVLDYAEKYRQMGWLE